MKIFFKKKYGQHILVNKKIIKKIISLINPKYHHIMVEIGPGLGALTIPMTKYNQNISIIEIDKNFVNFLKKKQILINSNINIILHNVLNFNFLPLIQKYKKRIRIFGNLPYNISTKIIFYLFNYLNNIKDMHFIMQKEIVNRLTAYPGGKNYGCLSIMIQLFCKTKALLEIQPNNFYPKPKIFSNMIYMRPYINNSYNINNIFFLKKIIKQAFSMRRKILRNSLMDLFSIEELNYLGIDYKIRAEDVSISEYCQLANWLKINYKRL
ncbi:16S rRNA (adenine(1518)-N(6)/adenine(1519)-N(6))-dimethyltransferase RsmA [Enterobacteriaceae endosymbiont of Donacia cincticornis]|uniref:16S rRNA (adenine(1518)-N(6)/adenine(1519)-N(6))- dimethyltransferase RsmA n=1 Tax=Enterobacteriaceae endosymbiont of Donacia cincticornis TaxID=2675773 RepID=UPI0014498031|nr:16S rRNA (adenine(1518)-N(6)/adenine(1519)-N(6))-dimethyltransferase RsmA [Enterobacteriaceae endosymbiont of Donacia cincticornis]QJC36052.1 16S rRNA (adenine(1518)-N(6)/adenine(1519)-N(6))-dimethyltransferase RsmA [Enterobacteriaceae endosymbiont of Donacia cincticornis]